MSAKDGQCSECKFWQRHHTPATEEAIDSMGRCRKKAPSCFEYVGTAWPETAEFDWCGEFEVVE